LLASLNRIAGTSLEAVYQDERAGDVRHSQADISKARRILGYEPIVSFEDGLKKTLAWCRTDLR
jgi:nucleoside-diphosphate-sugar epimerase